MCEGRKQRCGSIEGGPWGCTVVISAFFIQFLTFGTTQSIGVYNIEFLRYYKTSAAAVSLVGSISLGVVLGTGPLASLLMTRWSHRQVAIFGAILCNVGLICMPFAPNLEYMYAFYGIISGLGYCLVYVPSHVLSGLYFHKHRSLATGIATAGSGMGAAIFPIILYNIIEYYGWRGSLFIVAGLNLHLLVFAALLRPVPKHLKRRFAEAEELQSMIPDADKNVTHITSRPVNGDIVISTSENGDINHKFNDADNTNQNCSLKSNQVDDQHSSTESGMLQKKEHNTTIERLKKHFAAVFTLDFIIFWFSNICWNAGGAIILIFFPEYAYSVGLSKENASIAYTMAGAGSCIGCVLGGFLGNVKNFNRIFLYIFGNLGGGIVTLLLPWEVLHTFVGLFMISLVFGLHFGVILGLLVVVTSDLLGTEALGDGFGYLMLANGIGVFSGPPLAGLLMDHYGNQDLGMYFSGVLTVTGGVTMLAVYIRHKICHTKLNSTDRQLTIESNL